MCPLPCSQTPSQVEPDAPHGTGPCMGTMMCRRVLVSAVNPPPRPLQANLAGSRGLFARSQIWLTRCEYCSHWPVLRTAGCARPQAILGCEATCIRSRIVESQPWRSRDSGPTNALLCVRGGCSPGQRCSQRPYMGAPSAPRARGTLTVPTAYYRSHMVAVHGRPGHIWSRVGDFGSAFSTSGPGGPVVPPRGPTPHIHRCNRITLILILCIGFACVRADSGELAPREGEKTSKRNS